jgi:AraC-like DNA-binding protein
LRKHSYGRISELLSPIISGDSDIISRDEEYDGVTETVDSLFRAASAEDEFRELNITAELSRLFYILYTEGRIAPRERNSLTGHQTRTMTTLINWIEKNYTEKITLDDMATQCGLTPKYLCAFFKKMTGYTPTEYINRYRIEKACLALSDGHTSITDAAFDNGFNELSYFSKLFKKHMNCTPREFRNSINK